MQMFTSLYVTIVFDFRLFQVLTLTSGMPSSTLFCSLLLDMPIVLSASQSAPWFMAIFGDGVCRVLLMSLLHTVLLLSSLRNPSIFEYGFYLALSHCWFRGNPDVKVFVLLVVLSFTI